MSVIRWAGQGPEERDPVFNLLPALGQKGKKRLEKGRAGGQGGGRVLMDTGHDFLTIPARLLKNIYIYHDGFFSSSFTHVCFLLVAGMCPWE